MGKRNKSGEWIKFAPIVIGLLVTPVALRSAGILALSGPGALTALYPWAELLRSPLLGISAAIADGVGQWVMYLQFPIYGLAMTWIMLRKRSFGVALLVVVFFHVMSVVAVFGMSYLRELDLRL
jgi:hypothetical protein